MTTLPPGLIRDANSTPHCAWCGDDPLYVDYHHTEWGLPVDDDTRLFEKLCLEGFQAGLSWITILRKREAFREAFHGFELERVARMTDREVNLLVKNPGIVRHRGKIVSTINNANRVLEIIEREGSLARLIWGFEPSPKTRPKSLDLATVHQLTETAESKALSKTLKKCGLSFVGPTTAYAFMQSMGLVNDHLEGCAQREVVTKARARFARPTATPDARS